MDQIVVTPKPQTTRRPYTTTTRPLPIPALTQRPLAGIFQGMRNWFVGAFLDPQFQSPSQFQQPSRYPQPALAAVFVRPTQRPRPATRPQFNDYDDFQILNTVRTTKATKTLQSSPNILDEVDDQLGQIKERPRAIRPNTKLEELEQTTKRRPVTQKPRLRTTTARELFFDEDFAEVEEEPQRVRGQLVDAAINVTKAFSQFLGAAFQVSDC